MYKDLLLKLINDYLSCANYVCSLLKESNKSGESILRAIRTGKIPKEGYLDEDIHYVAHGVGCFFEIQNTKIDVDFGPNDRNDGFDIPRLKIFLESQGSLFKELNNEEETLSENFKFLIRKGLISNPKWPPSEHLYYLTSTIG